MGKLIKWLLIIGTLVGLVWYGEQKIGLVTALLNPEMTQEEENAYIKSLHDAILNRDDMVCLQYRGSGSAMDNFSKERLKSAFSLDDPDTSSDYDYMYYTHKASQISIRGVGNLYFVTYHFDYLQTQEQDAMVEREVKRILEAQINKKMSDYKKIKIIHDYMVTHIEYDTSTQQNTPYYALIEKRSACQGYAALFYKMMTEAGVPCRVITGKALDGLHAWNIVELNGKWYNIDVTWDDPIGASGVNLKQQYKYFLKADSDFRDHVRDEEFNSSTFYNVYPMAKQSYR